MIYGRHPVVDALQHGQPMEKVILQQGLRGPIERELRQLTKALNIPLQVVPKERLNKWTRGNHQGVIGLLSPIRYYRLEDVDYFGLSTLHDPVLAELGPAIRTPWFRPVAPEF